MTESQKKISTYLKKICSSACLTTSNQQEQVGTVEVVVPVFNATEAVKTCIAALLNHTSPKHRITLLDDASDDPELIIYYQQLQSNHPQTNIIRRESNLGYLQNVNLYLNDLNHAVVLLNSDTQVTAGWLDAMLAVASDSRVGMVCPLSDNATILTLKNHKPNHIDQLQGLFKQWYPIPTAVGFCLLIKAGWWQKLGGFDPYYQPGYGEENELSLQLRAQGSQVACAPAAFVYHSGSASFQQQTQTLQDQHQKMLNLRWPGNLAEIKRFSTTNPANYIDLWLQATTHHKPRMLHVVHGIDNKGGVELFTRQLLSNLGNDCHHTVLLPARISQHSTRRGTQSDQPFEILELDQNNFPLDHRIFHLPADLYQQPLDVHFKHVLEWGGFGHVHFHSMVGVGTAMWPQICHTLGITYDLFLHDHSALCQIFSLSTTQHQQEVYCGKTQAEPHSDTCQQCLADKTQETKLTTESYMALRHKIWQQHINNAAQIQVCSDYLLHTLSLHFKEIENRTVVINPSFAPSLVAPVSQPDPKALNVAFLGQFGVLKGAQLFIDLYHELSNQTFNWHIIGGIDSRFKIQLKATHITTTGSYEPEELPKLLADIDLIVFTSQIPETYGLTLTEALIHGVPVVAPDLGAYADRVQPGVNGFLYQFNRLEGLAKAVIQLSQLQCSPNRIEQTIWEAQPIDIIQQFNDHYLETIQAHAVELPQHQENLPSLPIPGFNAWQTMKAWLDAPRTLEAAADWHPLPESFKIFILGSDQALISATQDHLKILMPTAQFASQLNQDDVKAQGTEVVLLVDAGNRINENLGNWLAWFTASDAVLGLADFALHDQRQASYAPQFLGAFSWQNLCASGHNLGAALTKPSTWNPAVFADLTGRKLNVRSLLLAVHHHHPADIDHFPYFSYTMLDQQFVQHWKQLLHTKQPSPPPVKATVLLETNLTGKPLERLKKHLGQQTLLQQKQAKLICYPSTDRGVVVDKMTDSKNPIFVLTDNVRMTDKTGLERWLNALITQHMDVLSMPAARDQSRSWLIGKKAGASNHIQGVGRIKDLRFMLPEMAWQHDWIDDDFWLFSDVAWHSAAPIYRHDHSLFTAVKLSHHLQKQGMSCGIFPDQTMFKKGLPSLNPKQHKTPLNKQRDELIADQMHRPSLWLPPRGSVGPDYHALQNPKKAA